jgi:hypothetical protein
VAVTVKRLCVLWPANGFTLTSQHVRLHCVTCVHRRPQREEGGYYRALTTKLCDNFVQPNSPETVSPLAYLRFNNSPKTENSWLSNP